MGTPRVIVIRDITKVSCTLAGAPAIIKPARTVHWFEGYLILVAVFFVSIILLNVCGSCFNFFTLYLPIPFHSGQRWQ